MRIIWQGSKLAGARVPEALRFSAGHRDFRDSVPGWHGKNLGHVYICKYPGTRILGLAPRFFTLSARMALAKNHQSSSPDMGIIICASSYWHHYIGLILASSYSDHHIRIIIFASLYLHHHMRIITIASSWSHHLAVYTLCTCGELVVYSWYRIDIACSWNLQLC